MNREDQERINREMRRWLSKAFDIIHCDVELDGDYKPSDVADYLETMWGLGDFYREWWESDEDGEWN